MGYNFKKWDINQPFLLPPSLRDWLSEDHLVWFIAEVVNAINVSKFYSRYRSDGWGGESYHPKMMLALLLYSYCKGQRSSRKISVLCETDVAYRVISGNEQPEHSTISRFVQNFEKELADIFSDILKLCKAAGMLKVGRVTLDGTKVKANASISANREYKWLKKEVEEMIKEVKAVDKAEDEEFGIENRGDELPAKLRGRKKRQQRIKEAKERLDREAKEEADEKRKKIEERKEEEKRTGKKKRGRKPKEPSDEPDPKKKANITDAESRIMKTRKGLEQCYNGQLVTNEEQIILAAEVTQDENDQHQLKPMLEIADIEIEKVDAKVLIEEAVADAGYWNETEIKEIEKKPDAPELFIAVKNDYKKKKKKRKKKKLTCAQRRMKKKLSTDKGKEIYLQRGEIEAVIGQKKDVIGLRSFRRRGKPAANSEWRFGSSAHNVLKLYRKLKNAGLKLRKLLNFISNFELDSFDVNLLIPQEI